MNFNTKETRLREITICFKLAQNGFSFPNEGVYGFKSKCMKCGQIFEIV